MLIDLLRENDPQWDETVAAFPSSDVYFSSGYHAAHALHEDGTAWAVRCRSGSQIFFHCGISRLIKRVGREPVAPCLRDFESVYGYSGPLSTTDDPDFLSKAWAAVDALWREHRVVAEFTRFHPYLDNHRWAGPGSRVIQDRETVSVDLSGDEVALWNRYPSPQRQKVRQAQRRGVVAREWPLAEGFPVFRHLYQETMRHVGASGYYDFDTAYFDLLAARLGPALRIFVATLNEQPIAAVLFLVSGGRMHYHLGGSAPAARDARPNNLLFHEVARWGQQRGFTSMHLGGGRTASPDDELFRFKASLSRERRAFRLGMRICDGAAYDELCARWMAQRADGSRPAYFLLYRLPVE